MIDPALLTAAVSGVMGGGFIGAGVAVYTARKKVPAEVDSIIVSGAETAVVSLERTLAAETRRADRAEATVAARDARIAALEARTEALESRLDTIQRALDDARAELHRITQNP